MPRVPGHRWGPVLGLLAAVLLLAGCGGTTPAKAPSEGAARLVPGDALAYLHLSLDRTDSAVTQTEGLVSGLPGYSAVVLSLKQRLSAITSSRFSTQIAPWLGTEAAVAFVPEGTSASELIVLGVARGPKARAAAKVFASGVNTGSGADSGVEARYVDGYVVVGDPALTAGAGRGRTLAGNAAYRRAEAGAPTNRVLEAYGTGSGLAELLDGHVGLAGLGAAILDAEDPSDVAAAVSPTAHGLGVWVHLVGVPGAITSFRPTLAAHLPAATTWAVQMSSLVGSTPGLLSILASASSFGTGASSVADLVSKLGPALQAEGVSTAPLQALFNHTSAIFDLDNSIGVMTNTHDMKSARLIIGNAGDALAQLFAISGGQSDTTAPLVGTADVHGVEVTQYEEGTGAQLDLAVFGGEIVITTSRQAMNAIILHKTSLAGSAPYQSVVPETGRSAGPVLFGAINRLVRGGGQTGLLQSLGLAGATRMLSRITAAGLASTSGTTQSTAELYFTIS